MPVYEYRCNKCQRKYSVLVRSLSAKPEPVCQACGSNEASRLFSTFARVKTDKDVYDEILNDDQLTQRMMANDPTAMLEWSRKMEGTEAEKTPEYEEVVQRMERGENVQGIISDIQRREMITPEADSAMDSALDD